jgi:hypothetical protein
MALYSALYLCHGKQDERIKYSTHSTIRPDFGVSKERRIAQGSVHLRAANITVLYYMYRETTMSPRHCTEQILL